MRLLENKNLISSPGFPKYETQQNEGSSELE